MWEGEAEERDKQKDIGEAWTAVQALGHTFATESLLVQRLVNLASLLRQASKTVHVASRPLGQASVTAAAIRNLSCLRMRRKQRSCWHLGRMVKGRNCRAAMQA